MALLHEHPSLCYRTRLRSRLPQAQDPEGNDEREVEKDGLAVSRVSSFSPLSLLPRGGADYHILDGISGNGILIGGSTSTVRFPSSFVSSTRRLSDEKPATFLFGIADHRSYLGRVRRHYYSLSFLSLGKLTFPSRQQNHLPLVVVEDHRSSRRRIRRDGIRAVV